VFAGLGGTAPGSALDGPRAGGPTAPDVGALQQTFLAGFRGALMVSAAVAAIGVAAALVRGDERRPLPARAPASDRA